MTHALKEAEMKGLTYSEIENRISYAIAFVVSVIGFMILKGIIEVPFILTKYDRIIITTTTIACAVAWTAGGIISFLTGKPHTDEQIYRDTEML